MLFVLRKLIVTLLAPSLWGYAALAAGLALLFIARWRGQSGRAARWGRRVLAVGLAWLLLLSLGLPFDMLGRWLEGRHPPLLDPQAEGAAWVVVLGGGQRAAPGLPVSAQLPEAALYRVVEGVRLHRLLPESRLLFTGYGGPGQRPAAEVGAALARALGVEASRIQIEGAPRTTREEARAVRALAGEGPVVLVTSATHMPRSVWLFEHEGVAVIPAPTGQAAPRGLLRGRLWPAAHRLEYADTVAHELFGLAAQRLGL